MTRASATQGIASSCRSAVGGVDTQNVGPLELGDHGVEGLALAVHRPFDLDRGDREQPGTEHTEHGDDHTDDGASDGHPLEALASDGALDGDPPLAQARFHARRRRRHVDRDDLAGAGSPVVDEHGRPLLDPDSGDQRGTAAFAELALDVQRIRQPVVLDGDRRVGRRTGLRRDRLHGRNAVRRGGNDSNLAVLTLPGGGFDRLDLGLISRLLGGLVDLYRGALGLLLQGGDALGFLLGLTLRFTSRPTL